MTNLFQVPAIIDKVTTMADKSLRLQVDTQELNAVDMVNVISLYNKPGFFLFKEAEISKEDLLSIPDVVIDKGDKTPSQRLRNVLYLLWKQDKKNFDTDAEHYKATMEKIINYYKEKLT